MGLGPLAPGTHVAPLLWLVLAAIGLVTCFFGYRLFRLLLGTWGFVAGAALGSAALQGVELEPLVRVLAALVAGILGALAVSLLYSLGVFLFGAGFGVLLASLVLSRWHLSPEWALVVALALVGGIVALMLQRVMIVLASAFGGASTATLAVVAILRGCSSDAWPSRCVPESWSPVVAGVCIVLGLVGVAAQTGLARRRPRVRARDEEGEG